MQASADEQASAKTVAGLSSAKEKIFARTTEDLFGELLHQYTIVNAIKDHNVLPFRIDYINTVKQKKSSKDEQVKGIEAQKTLESPQRVKQVVSYILKHFDQKTYRNAKYDIDGKRRYGFNSILAVSSIKMCKRYYAELKKQIEEKKQLDPNYELQIATIFTYSPNKDDTDDDFYFADDETDLHGMSTIDREFLDQAISDFNSSFANEQTKSSAAVLPSTSNFNIYYRALSAKVKNGEIDLLIVVNMFLTGFDAPGLNTLWVDRNLHIWNPPTPDTK